jgi:hypothetical protein
MPSRELARLNWTPVVDGEECGAYALGQLTGPGILRDMTCRLVLLLILLQAHNRWTSLRIAFCFFR